LPAEEEVVGARLAAAVGAADEDVGRDAPEVVDHVVVDEAGEAAVVRPDLGPGRRAAGRHLAVVDRRAVAVVVDDEVPGPREPGADGAAIGGLGAHEVAEAGADGRAHGDGAHAHGAHSGRTYFRAAAPCNRAQCPGTPAVPGRNRNT